MKKRIPALFLTLCMAAGLLTGCVRAVPAGPDCVTIDGKTYKTGFYGSLFPHEFELTGSTLSGKNLELRQIRHDSFELYHADIGSYLEGTIYCGESCYDQATAYYQNPQNYSYFCILGVNSTTSSTRTLEIPLVDTAKFDALLDFAEASDYSPFDSKHNAAVEKVELPMPDNTKMTRMVFYKESHDSLFVSSTGDEYYIIDGVLYLVYQYDFGHGAYEKLIAVKVPEEIGRYFVEFMTPYLQKGAATLAAPSALRSS